MPYLYRIYRTRFEENLDANMSSMILVGIISQMAQDPHRLNRTEGNVAPLS
jgi:hypothetical protein